MRDGFDCSELMDFAERLGAQPKEMLKAQKKMLRTSGTKLRRKTAQRARLMCAVQPSIVQSMTVRQATITEASSAASSTKKMTRFGSESILRMKSVI